MRIHFRIKKILIKKCNCKKIIQLLRHYSVFFSKSEEDSLEIFFPQNTILDGNIFEKLSSYLTKIDHFTFHENTKNSISPGNIFLNLNQFILRQEDVKISLDLLDLLLIKLKIETKLISRGKEKILFVNLENHKFIDDEERKTFNLLLEKSLIGIYKIL